MPLEKPKTRKRRAPCLGRGNGQHGSKRWGGQTVARGARLGRGHDGRADEPARGFLSKEDKGGGLPSFTNGGEIPL